MAVARIVLDPNYVIAAVDPRVFGGFAEHLGRHIYTGMYEPDHPDADELGFRRDVLALVRELGLPVMRYPGGNFVSGYNWEDGVGPAAERPTRLDLAWKTTETNRFGTNEFMDWCGRAETAPMLAVNLGTRGPEEARQLLEYCNHPSGSYWSDLRRQHGYEQPHDVRLWCLGNEMDGPWQMGRKTADEYGRIAAETGRLMKMYDSSLELVACGSSNRGMPDYGHWELTVLDHCFEQVDYLSLHSYFGKPGDDVGGLLASADHMDWFIEEVVACADAIAAKRRSKKRVHLCFDEYNIMWRGVRCTAPDWSIAPAHHETVYRVEDALAFGGLLISLMNHADRVKIACVAQVVNVIGLILTEPGGRAWRQSIFWPFAQASRHGRGTVLQPSVQEQTVYDAANGEGFAHLKFCAVRSEDGRELTLFALNRDLAEPCSLGLDLRAFGDGVSVLDWQVLADADLLAVNTAEEPDRVRPRPSTGATIQAGRLQAQLAPASWNVIRLQLPG